MSNLEKALRLTPYEFRKQDDENATFVPTLNSLDISKKDKSSSRRIFFNPRYEFNQVSFFNKFDNFHRDNGPAIIFSNGEFSFYQHGNAIRKIDWFAQNAPTFQHPCICPGEQYAFVDQGNKFERIVFLDKNKNAATTRTPCEGVNLTPVLWKFPEFTILRPVKDLLSPIENTPAIPKIQENKTMNSNSSPKVSMKDRTINNAIQGLYQTAGNQATKITQEVLVDLLAGSDASSDQRAWLAKRLSTEHGQAVIKLLLGTSAPHLPYIGEFVQNNKHAMTVVDQMQASSFSYAFDEIADRVRAAVGPKMGNLMKTIEKINQLEAKTGTRVEVSEKTETTVETTIEDVVANSKSQTVSR